MKESIERLRALAIDALKEYSEQTMSHGGEPEFPQWAKDALIVCKLADTALYPETRKAKA